MRTQARYIREGDVILNVHGEQFKVTVIEKAEFTTTYNIFAYPVDRPRAGTAVIARDYDDIVEVVL